MKNKTLPIVIAFTAIVFAACESKPAVTTERATVKTEPVKTYQEIVKSDEITDTFNVALYETKYTFKYLIKINFKGIEATDSLRIPNLGYEPQPEIKQGEVRPSCIIGFLDDKKQFMEGNEVLFKDNQLLYHPLKSYDVSEEK
ncbi:hypothetical protein [Parafilimonas terrae]|uniref:Lipoprotein n=1 Tax=Parafilimonas terrae TaxID=1465490 RepID=A0A1I5YZ08_9BACT|nr:hypothetical protein [Parafilimonas terrae]SFQ49484.1 hypothetical protein SAMN05444277_11510 [Parafilimonas terrae]